MIELMALGQNQKKKKKISVWKPRGPHKGQIELELKKQFEPNIQKPKPQPKATKQKPWPLLKRYQP